MQMPVPVLLIEPQKHPQSAWDSIARLAGLGPVTICSDGGEARRLLGAGSFGLILCGYRLGDETGTGLIAALRAEGCRVPAIIISDSIDTEGVIEASTIPSADFLPAPFTTSELRLRIHLLGVPGTDPDP